MQHRTSLSRYFPQVVAVVVEKGGVLSHLAVLAREVGVPAVVCDNALSLLTNGAEVRVDGAAGRIEIVTPPRTPV